MTVTSRPVSTLNRIGESLTLTSTYHAHADTATAPRNSGVTSSASVGTDSPVIPACQCHGCRTSLVVPCGEWTCKPWRSDPSSCRQSKTRVPQTECS